MRGQRHAFIAVAVTAVISACPDPVTRCQTDEECVARVGGPAYCDSETRVCVCLPDGTDGGDAGQDGGTDAGFDAGLDAGVDGGDAGPQGCGDAGPCSAGQHCVGERCVCDYSSCPTGCCQGDRCITAPTESACGAGGAQCQTCPAGQTCDAGACTGCNATSCSTGCCSGSTCVNPPTRVQCGIAGQTCSVCDGLRADRCDNGQCRCGPGAPCMGNAFCADQTCKTSWDVKQSMGTARAYHAAVTLADGRILVVGGVPSFGLNWSASAEIFNPASGSWTAAPSTTSVHTQPTATLLNDGRVLVVGGSGASLYNPATNTWSPTGPMRHPRYGHTSTLLNDGSVLVAGGYGTGYVAEAERFDPATASWSAAGSLSTPRETHTATLLSNGRVLVAGGISSMTYHSTTEIYDPTANLWSPAAALTFARSAHAAVRLPDGKVLVTGGQHRGTTGTIQALDKTELYDPMDGSRGSWAMVGSMAVARNGPTLDVLPDGTALVVGGLYSGGAWSTAEVFDPATRSWKTTRELSTGRAGHATALTAGKVYVIGGGVQPAASWNALSSVEAY